MKTYKLKKLYPGSLPLGTIVRYSKVDDLYEADKLSEIFSREDIEKFPEFWEPVEFVYKTDDNVLLKTGDECYHVTVNYGVYKSSVNSTAYVFTDNKYKVPTFALRENAEKYIILNKPCLSINDVAKVYVTANQYDPSNPTKNRKQSEAIFKMVCNRVHTQLKMF